MYAPTATDRVTGSAPLRRRQAVARGVGRVLGRIQVSGLDRLPAGGPVLLAVNHRSALDGLLLFGLVRRPVTFLVKDEAFVPAVGTVLRSAGQVPIVRGRVDAGPVRLALRVLDDGGVVGIFPEGSRGDGLVRAAKPGVGYLALRSGAAVVPVACHRTDAMSHRNGVRRPAAWLVFGDPMRFERHPAGRPLNRRAVAQTTEQIRRALAELVDGTARPAGKAAAA